jgi:hypothetical protein
MNYQEISKTQLLEIIHNLETNNKALIEELSREKKFSRFLKNKLLLVKKHETELVSAAKSFESMSNNFAQYVKSALTIQSSIFVSSVWLQYRSNAFLHRMKLNFQ